MSLIQKIVWEIADREGVDPTDLETPLNEVVDIDALETFSTGTEDRHHSPYADVEFVYCGYTVSIDETGTVSISDQPSTTAKLLRRTPNTISNEIAHRERAMKDIADVIAARERPFVERLDGLLEVVRKTLGMESATLSYVDTDSYVFEAIDRTGRVELQAGEIVPLADTVCKRVVESEQALVLRDVEQEAPELAGSACEVSSYIGVPVFVDRAVYGTFCFYDTDPRDEAFSDWDRAVVELLGNWVSSELEQRRQERALDAATTERPRVG
jgi:hypothetical protein